VTAVELLVNGENVRCKAGPTTRLIDFLRDELGLTGTKEGCREGECGSCTVLLDGLPVNACLVLLGKCDGRSVLTVEGVSDGTLHPLQEAFIEAGAVQCGYCTPGMVMAALGLLMRDPRPGEEQIRMALSGNFCRCTGYESIVKAVQLASERLIQDGP